MCSNISNACPRTRQFFLIKCFSVSLANWMIEFCKQFSGQFFQIKVCKYIFGDLIIINPNDDDNVGLYAFLDNENDELDIEWIGKQFGDAR